MFPSGIRPGQPAAIFTDTPKSPTPCGGRRSSWLYTKKSGKEMMNDTHDLGDRTESPFRRQAQHGLEHHLRHHPPPVPRRLRPGGRWCRHRSRAAGCGTGPDRQQHGTGAAKGRPGASGETLFVAGFQWGPPTSFNPFAAIPGRVPRRSEPADLRDACCASTCSTARCGPVWPRSSRSPTSTFVLPLQEGTSGATAAELTAEDVVFTFDAGQDSGSVVTPTSGTTWTRSPPSTRARCDSSSRTSRTTQEASRTPLPPS